MTQDEIKALNDAITTGGDTLTNYITGLNPTEPQQAEITLDGVKKFLNENEDGKKYLQSYSDGKVTAGIETFKKNNLQKLVDEQYKKLHPEQDPKDKEMADMKAEIAKIKADSLRKDNANMALKSLTEKKLPTELVNFIVGADEETTNKNLETLTNIFNNYAESVKTGFTKDNGYVPPTDKKTPTSEDQKAYEAAKAQMEKIMGIKLT